MFTHPIRSIVNVAVLLLASAVADDSTPDSTGCVDPSGFEQCYKANSDALTTCVNTVSDRCSGATDECLAACGNVQNAANIGCWVQSCWNHAYSCDYQFAAITYLNVADRVQGTIDIPFYPPPVNAPGGCVCNLGDVWGNLTVAPLQTNNCIDFVNDGTQATADCNCCFISSIFSDVIYACPANDISALLGNDTLSTYQQAESSDSPDNCAILSTATAQCSDAYSYDIYATSWANVNALPTGFPGTEPLSDKPGEVTSLDFDVYTLELFPAYTTTITPAPYNSKNAHATGGNQGAVSGGLSGGGSLVSGTSVTGTVPITALVPSTTAGGKSGSGSTGTSSAAAATSSKPNSASKMSAAWFISAIAVLGALVLQA